jgi:hypothetical protein
MWNEVNSKDKKIYPILRHAQVLSKLYKSFSTVFSFTKQREITLG